MPLPIAPKTFDVSAEATSKTTQLKDLSTELMLAIIKNVVNPKDVISLELVDRRFHALIAADIQKWLAFGLQLPSPHPRMSLVVSRQIKSLKPHAQAVIPQLKEPFDVFSPKSIEAFSSQISFMNDRIWSAQESFKNGCPVDAGNCLKWAAVDAGNCLKRAAAHAERAGVEMLSLSALGMDSFHRDCMNVEINFAQESFKKGYHTDAGNSLKRAAAHAKKADEEMPSLSVLGMDSF